MSDQSYITPTKECPVVSQAAGEASFPEIQGERYEIVEVFGKVQVLYDKRIPTGKELNSTI